MASPTSQTDKLPIIPSEQGILKDDFKSLISLPWIQWFLALSAKINTINVNSVGWAGVPVDNGTPGTYGDATHYPIITTNINGLVTNVTLQALSGSLPSGGTIHQVLTKLSSTDGDADWETPSGGGGDPTYVNLQTSSYSLLLTDIPAASSYKGAVGITSSSTNTITVPPNSSVAYPIGSELQGMCLGTGQTSFYGGVGVSFVGPTITGSGKGTSGKIIQIQTDLWLVSGAIPYRGYVATTWNPSDKGSGLTLSVGNTLITHTGSTNTWYTVRGTNGHNAATANNYFEVDWDSINTSIGVMNLVTSLSGAGVFPGGNTTGWAIYAQNMTGYIGTVIYNNTFTSYAGAQISSRIGILLKNGKLYFRKSDGTWYGGANIVTETGAAFSGLTGILYPAVGIYNGSPGTSNGYFAVGSLSMGLPTGASIW